MHDTLYKTFGSEIYKPSWRIPTYLQKYNLNLYVMGVIWPYMQVGDGPPPPEAQPTNPFYEVGPGPVIDMDDITTESAVNPVAVQDGSRRYLQDGDSLTSYPGDSERSKGGGYIWVDLGKGDGKENGRIGTLIAPLERPKSKKTTITTTTTRRPKKVRKKLPKNPPPSPVSDPGVKSRPTMRAITKSTTTEKPENRLTAEEQDQLDYLRDEQLHRHRTELEELVVEGRYNDFQPGRQSHPAPRRD